jgi:hypothetical protein
MGCHSSLLPVYHSNMQVVSRDIRRILTQRANYFNIVLDDVSITQLTFRWGWLWGCSIEGRCCALHFERLHQEMSCVSAARAWHVGRPGCCVLSSSLGCPPMHLLDPAAGSTLERLKLSRWRSRTQSVPSSL